MNGPGQVLIVIVGAGVVWFSFWLNGVLGRADARLRDAQRPWFDAGGSTSPLFVRFKSWSIAYFRFLVIAIGMMGLVLIGYGLGGVPG